MMIKKSSLFSLGIYSLIVLFWSAIIIGFLYASHLTSLLKRQTSINILTWGNIFDTTTLAEFSRRTGIKVNINYYTTNEELFVTLKAAKGKGYDLIVPSDYAVKILREQGLLKKLDKSRLTFLPALNPNLMGHDYDPSNEYSLPYMIEIFGLGFSKTFFKGHLPDPSWKWIFNDPCCFTIVMVNDPIEATNLAAFYLATYAYRGAALQDIPIEKIKELLIKQKEWVEAYADFRPDYFLLTGTSPLVVTALSSALRAMQQSADIGFIAPPQGTFVSIENLALSVGSSNQDAVYQFMNYVYTPEVTENHFKNLSSIPATIDVLPTLALNQDLKKIIFSIILKERSEFKKSTLFFTHILPEKALRELWVEVKS